MDNKGTFIIPILVGLLAIIGGFLFIIDKSGAAGVVIGVGLLIEALRNWIK